MGHKIELEYEAGSFAIKINDNTVQHTQNFDEAVALFKQTIKNNGGHADQNFELIKQEILALGLTEVSIEEQYRTISMGKMKFFYNSGKVFYITEDGMIPIVGDYAFFKHVLGFVAKGYLDDYEAFVKLCMEVAKAHATYSVSDEGIFIASAAFNYGSVGYYFANGKMDRGTSSERCSFEVFINYVLSVI